MIGDRWPSEMSACSAAKPGRQITQLTRVGNNVHMYFTENSFHQNGKEIIFTSDRASGENVPPHEDPRYNLVHMDLETGVITQLTDEPEGIRPHATTKTPDGQIIVYMTGKQIKALFTSTGQVTTIYAEQGNFTLAAPSIAANRRYIAFARNEDVKIPSHLTGVNYFGFKDRYYRIKDGRITLAYLDGSGALDVFRDTHQLAHFQFCPDDPTIATFCHEGPWNLVAQRIWLLDLVSREAKPCFRQEEKDSIGHEFWTQDSLIFFDNRGPGHDGTITSDRTQAVLTEVKVNENQMIPFVGWCDRSGKLVKQLAMPFYCNHYHANPDNTLLVGDDVDELVLISTSQEPATLETLCTHGTSWRTQTSHCHPTWSGDGRRILYASDAGGRVNLYLIDL